MSINSINGVTRFTADLTFQQYFNSTPRACLGRSISPPRLSFVCDFRVCRVQSIPASVNKFITRRVGGQKMDRENRGEQGVRSGAVEGSRRQRIGKVLLAGGAHKPRVTRLSDYLITRQGRRWMAGLVS